MTTLFFRRCALVTGMVTLFAIGSAAQQQMPPTLRQRAAKEGHARTSVIIDYFRCCADLADVIQQSSLIVRGQVTSLNSRLSTDERGIWTDYAIKIDEIYKQPANGGLSSGQKVQVTKEGGRLLVDGHPVEVDTPGFPPIPKGVPEIFFISECTRSDCPGTYMFTAPYGHISVDNGQVNCPTNGKQPDPVWAPYCRLTTDQFVSTVKEKVAASVIKSAK
jgi:hypothetical protein